MSNCPICGVPLKGKNYCPCGWKAETASNHWPRTCMVDDCENDTAVVMVVGEINKKLVKAAPSAFFTRDKNQSLTDNLQEGCKFESWYTRCADCYTRELYTAGKATELRTHCMDYHNQFMKDHPEFAFKPTNEQESKEFQEMCMRYIKKSMRQISNKLPYSKTDRLAEPEYDEAEEVRKIQEHFEHMKERYSE